MKCPICKHSEVNPGQKTVTLERDGMAVVFRAWWSMFDVSLYRACLLHSSLPANVVRIARAVRSHLEVENRLHFRLDGAPQKHRVEVRRARTDCAEATWKMSVGPSESAFRSRL